MKIQLLGLLALAVGLNGCATYKSKFNNKQVANIGYFADSTIAMMGDLDLTVDREDTLLVRRFIDMESPEVREVSKWNTSLKLDLTDMVGYSIELVNFAESDETEEERIQHYADYVAQYRDTIKDYEKIDTAGFDKTIAEVRKQETFLAAVRTAQPLFNAATMEASLKVDRLVAALDKLAKKIDAEIDREYSDIIQYRSKLEREKFDILTAFEIVYDAYRKDDPELSALKASRVIWTPEIIPEGRPTQEDLREIGDHLHRRMEALNSVQQEVKPNWEDYLATHKELNAFADNAARNAQKSRIVLLTWIRAHQKMASGTVDPADWFDVGDITKQLIKNSPQLLF